MGDKKRLVLGEGKIIMSESDFIDLCIKLSNTNACVNAEKCTQNCEECWSELLSKEIEI